jgi:hypothetical protein
MRWKDIRFGGKMMIGIGAVLVMLSVVAKQGHKEHANACR